jgi:uncharacterized protein
VKILSVSDIEINFIYSPLILERFKDVDLVISCGDLPYYYLEYITSMLNRPLCYVRGNHANQPEHSLSGTRFAPWGGTNLHRRVLNESGLLLAGIEGSVLYNYGPCQYSQAEMWRMTCLLTPQLFLNYLRHGRYLDVFVSHASPWGIHDLDDLPHHGIKAFRWLIHVFKPRYHLHGHIHVYRSDTIIETQMEHTRVINSFGYHQMNVDVPELRHAALIHLDRAGS